MTTEIIKADCSLKLEFDGEECSILTFHFQCLEMKIECVFFEPDHVYIDGLSRKTSPRKTWELFLMTYDLESKLKPEVIDLIFGNSNGDVSISRKEKETEFIVSKFDSGGDGSLNVCIPNKIAKPLLIKGFKMLVAAKVFE